MTAAELIKELQQLDPNKEVLISIEEDSELSWYEVSGIEKDANDPAILVHTGKCIMA